MEKRVHLCCGALRRTAHLARREHTPDFVVVTEVAVCENERRSKFRVNPACVHAGLNRISARTCIACQFEAAFAATIGRGADIVTAMRAEAEFAAVPTLMPPGAKSKQSVKGPRASDEQ